MSFRIKAVFVHTYKRFRYGKWETVRQHWRSAPTQIPLF